MLQNLSEKSRFYQFVLDQLPFELSGDQHDLLAALERFVREKEEKGIFLLKGFAGTGKTSVVGAFVKSLNAFKVKTKLLAPTGRAAKVFALKSDHEALTIHKQIYFRQTSTSEFSNITLKPNLHRNTLFIVDEASMIGEYSMMTDGNVGSRNLLHDLFDYVYSGKNCKLILMGDTGQLPPVGSDESPALNIEYLKHHFFQLKVHSFSLTQVLRQSEESGILWNATMLRSVDQGYPKFKLKGFNDVLRIHGGEFQEYLESSYSFCGIEETIVITRSNKRANAFNNQIRARVHWYEDVLCQGDCLMVIKNNYYWLDDNSKMGFIANGETMKVKRLKRIEEIYGFEFAHLTVNFIDYEEIGDVDVIVLLESLQVEETSINRTRMKTLFFEIEKDYLHEKNKRKRYDMILKNPYFNALQIKYAYAVTCHKSQGGQWEHVYVDQGYIPEDSISQEYYRWLYTAVTRATGKLYLVNFTDDFFAEPS